MPQTDPHATGSRAATVHCTGCGDPILVHSDPERPRRCPECAHATPDRAANRPICPSCGEPAPYGDERISWLDWHEGWMHRSWWWAQCRVWAFLERRYQRRHP